MSHNATIDEVQKIMDKLLARYPFGRDDEVVNQDVKAEIISEYMQALARYPYPVINYAYKLVCDNCTYFPKQAELIKFCEEGMLTKRRQLDNMLDLLQVAMTGQTGQELYDKILSKIDDKDAIQWIVMGRFYKFSKGVLSIAYPSNYYRNIVKDRYGNLLLSLAKDLGDVVDIDLIVAKV